jgi:hypothetical protein
MSLTSSDPQETTLSVTSEVPPQAPNLDGSPVASVPDSTEPATESASYVKLAMRNMVKKGRKSLTHFFLTTTALIGLLVGLSYLTR